MAVASSLSIGWVSSLSSVGGGSPDHVIAVCGPDTGPGIRPVIHDGQLEALALLSWFPAAFPLPAFASWSSCARPGVGRSSRSAYRPQGPDPDGVSVFHTHELRSGWVPSLLRGLWCSSRPESLTDRHPRPLNRWSLNPATTIHLCGALLDEASTKGSRVFTRPIFPSPVATGWNGSPLAFPRAPHPAITRDARRGGDRSSSTDLNQRSMSST
jgi:hypothetical protein